MPHKKVDPALLGLRKGLMAVEIRKKCWVKRSAIGGRLIAFSIHTAQLGIDISVLGVTSLVAGAAVGHLVPAFVTMTSETPGFAADVFDYLFFY